MDQDKLAKWQAYEEREAAIAANPDYGKVVCRCETVTEAEIIAALRAHFEHLRRQAEALTAENDILRVKLEHKEELLALHNYYIKTKAGE